VINLQKKRVRSSLPRITRLIRGQRPDIVFSTLDYLTIALAATRSLWPSQTKFIARPTVLLSAALAGRKVPRFWREVTKIALSTADQIVFQSPEMEHDYARLLKWTRKGGVVIRNPIDLGHLRRCVAVTSERAELTPAKFNLVAAGRLEAQKGFDIAIEAIKLMKQRDVSLTILGAGPLRKELEQHACRMQVQGQVHFAGYRSDVYQFLSRADGFLLSSRFEGFPNVVIEALACGTPVIATPVPGLESLFAQLPQCRLARDFTATALAQAIDEFVQAGRTRIPLDAISAFDLQPIVTQYEDMFTDTHLARPAGSR
jgi:glycosyltransferase involved in cell wall biosynthesis